MIRTRLPSSLDLARLLPKMVAWMRVGLLNLGEHVKQIRLDVMICDDTTLPRRSLVNWTGPAALQHNGYTCAKSFGRTTVHAPLLGHESAGK